MKKNLFLLIFTTSVFGDETVTNLESYLDWRKHPDTIFCTNMISVATNNYVPLPSVVVDPRYTTQIQFNAGGPIYDIVAHTNITYTIEPHPAPAATP